ncbi:superoxide dismutase [Effusibacillus lacus]|uniref:superoxide dismutase n=1 Tax=Effusibacillus lacus TaxID=1348429 RepID=A0A292YCE1_9BACL|nr:Fe-Mn family superoxide dismutase [Effusibacillus lacus]TCS75560.1 Fe-Mn family superoxide dismutase [Effusibacillus lacus]GAX89022.1 superoxide dismutase [Effusibacillus lacus]
MERYKGSLSQIELKPLPERTLQLAGISATTIKEHYKLYEGYVRKVNEVRGKLARVDLAAANPTYSEYRALKRGETFALNAVKLHELYFEQLGGKGGKPGSRILEMIKRDFGSYEAWMDRFRAAGKAARGWAILAYDQDYRHLFNFITDSQHDGNVLQATVILPMDVYEHSYFIDYGTNREGYIDAFFANLDWSVVNRRIMEVQPRRPILKLFSRWIVQ